MGGGLEGAAAMATRAVLRSLQQAACKAGLEPPMGQDGWEAFSAALQTACDMLSHAADSDMAEANGDVPNSPQTGEAGAL